MEPDLPSDSDASDEDYRPPGEESDSASEEESDVNGDQSDDNTFQCDDTKVVEKKKSKKCIKRRGVKRKSLPENPNEDTDEDSLQKKVISPEEEKKKADDIWADFLKDCDEPPKKRPSVGCSDSKNVIDNKDCRNCDENRLNRSRVQPETVAEGKENKESVIETSFEFAGETVKIVMDAPKSSLTSDSKSIKETVQDVRNCNAGKGGGRGRGGSALSSFLGQIGKKGKLSVLEKSKLDWAQFKKTEGIEDDINQHNKGKDGYLERQDFLQRTDVRQFEIEKTLRQKRSGR